jgi:hypothetical protein
MEEDSGSFQNALAQARAGRPKADGSDPGRKALTQARSQVWPEGAGPDSGRKAEGEGAGSGGVTDRNAQAQTRAGRLKADASDPGRKALTQARAQVWPECPGADSGRKAEGEGRKALTQARARDGRPKTNGTGPAKTQAGGVTGRNAQAQTRAGRLKVKAGRRRAQTRAQDGRPKANGSCPGRKAQAQTRAGRLKAKVQVGRRRAQVQVKSGPA